MLHFSLSRHFTRRPFCSVNCRFAGYKSSLNNPVFPYGISLSSQQQSRSLLPCSKSEHSEQFILHDGPPYANGEIHLGHALNKILKDITVRFEKLRGKDCSFIPGWDCHGLPIELSAMGVDLSLPPNQIRSASLTWATKCMQSQRLAFGEFNLLVDWSSVYSTLDLSYQSVVLKAFRDLCLKGYLVREPKPVYWSPRTNCAISESELEYNSEHESVSLYFLVKLHCSLLSTPDRFRFYPTFIVVWTTTPWTIVANEAIVFNPSERYSILLDETNKRLLVVSAAFVDFLSFLGGCRSYRRIADLPTGILWANFLSSLQELFFRTALMPIPFVAPLANISLGLLTLWSIRGRVLFMSLQPTVEMILTLRNATTYPLRTMLMKRRALLRMRVKSWLDYPFNQRGPLP
uniref:isoleucine--tRNA ligase n=1 Tax=Schistocephalus solidus TaxID=70667 RepID=A0A0X3Q2H4_SCHSO